MRVEDGLFGLKTHRDSGNNHQLGPTDGQRGRGLTYLSKLSHP